MQDIKQELFKIATENVNKKIEEERKKSEEKINREIDDVKFILELIEKRMLYKITGSWSESKNFVLITKEIFLEDYSKEPEYEWQKKLQVKKTKDWGSTYNLDIIVNGIEYKHIGYIIQDYCSELRKEKERLKDISRELYESEKRFEDMEKQELIIKKFIEDYNNIEKQLNKEE